MTAIPRDRDGEVPESRAARWRELARPVPLVALAWSAFQLLTWWDPSIDIMIQRGGHVSFAIALTLLATGEKSASRADRIAGRVLAAAAMLPAAYIAIEIQRITMRIPELDPVLFGDYASAVLVMVLLVEASRRAMGWGMCLVTLGFVAYQFLGIYLPPPFGHNQGGLSLFVDEQFLGLNGLFGIPIGVSVRVVFYFVLFAAVFEIYGGGRMITELALALTGRRVGGPAKAAIVGSAMMGMVSGSAVANVMGVGIFTIPLMKRAGYPSRFAAAVEAVGSTGGQLMPPVMGAGAFVMADFLRIPYSAVVAAAALPAVLYYVALFLAVDFKARLSGLRGIGAGDAADLRRILWERGHLLVPLAWLTVLIVIGYGVADACLQAIGLTIVVGSLRRTTRQGLFSLVQSFSVGAQRSISVALPTALAGIIVGVIAYTGLGTKFTSMVVEVSSGSAVALVVLSMAATLVLGCGMPTTSAYIMGAVLMAPALMAAGVPAIVAHMFVFYFAILSMITPPVALAAYAAAGIAGAPPAATGWQAALLGIPGLLIPLVFFWHPGLLLIGGAGKIALALALALANILALSAATIGWLFRPLGYGGRALFALLGVAAVVPAANLSHYAVLAIVALAAMQWARARVPAPTT